MTITFPFALILIPYAIIAAFFVLLAIINVWHLVEYGATNALTFTVTFLFLAGSATIFFLTWQGVAGTDWMQPISFGGSGAGIPTF